MSISAGGCCRVGAGRRGAHSRGPAPPGRSGARPATPGRRGGARPQQMLGDRARRLIQRWGGRRRGTPAVLAGTWRGEPQRVAGMVVGHGVVGDRDPRGDGGEQRPRQRIRQHRGGDAADLQPSRRVGQQVRLGGAPAAVRPRAAASAATTRSVTISWVSQRRSWRPSLVPLAGSAAARGPSRSRASAASTSSTATATPATVATTRSATMRAASRREEEPGNRLRPLMSRSPSPPANRPTDPRNRPEPGPTTARAPARPAGSHRKPAWPCPGRVARRRARAGRSTPRCPRG